MKKNKNLKSILSLILLTVFQFNFYSNLTPELLGYLSSRKNDLPDYYYCRMKGKLGDNLFITMEISKSDSLLSGYYYYDKLGKPISLVGKIKKDGYFILDEYNFEGKSTGQFSGILQTDAPTTGKWKNAKGDKSFPFLLNINVENAAAVELKFFDKRNCERIELIKNNPEHEPSYFDTSCSVHRLVMPLITLKNKSAEKSINE